VKFLFSPIALKKISRYSLLPFPNALGSAKIQRNLIVKVIDVFDIVKNMNLKKLAKQFNR